MSEASLSIGRQRVGAFSKRARVEKMPLNIIVCSRMREPLACMSECVPKTLACRGLRVGPSKNGSITSAKMLGVACLQSEVDTKDLLFSTQTLPKKKKKFWGNYPLIRAENVP